MGLFSGKGGDKRSNRAKRVAARDIKRGKKASRAGDRFTTRPPNRWDGKRRSQ